MAGLALKALGILLLLGGIAGYFLPERLWGMHFTDVHNTVYWSTGLCALLFGFTGGVKALRYCSLILGVLYLLFGLLGFIAPELIIKFIRADVLLKVGDITVMRGSLTVDSFIHILVGVHFFMIFGLAGETQPGAVDEESP